VKGKLRKKIPKLTRYWLFNVKERFFKKNAIKTAYNIFIPDVKSQYLLLMKIKFL